MLLSQLSDWRWRVQEQQQAEEQQLVELVLEDLRQDPLRRSLRCSSLQQRRTRDLADQSQVRIEIVRIVDRQSWCTNLLKKPTRIIS